MANAFKNSVVSDIGTTATAIYVAPAGVSATIIGITLANTTSNDVTIDIELEDTSAGTSAYMIKGVLIPTAQSFIPVGDEQKVVIETGDILKVKSDTAASVDAIVSVLEIS